MEAPPSYESSQNNAGHGNYGVGSGESLFSMKHNSDSTFMKLFFHSAQCFTMIRSFLGQMNKN